MSACTQVCTLPEFKDLDPAALVRYLLILRTNQHATGKELECTALYELGSKVTCTPQWIQGTVPNSHLPISVIDHLFSSTVSASLLLVEPPHICPR